MPVEKKVCPHCFKEGTLRYYKESNGKEDLYYCEDDYKLAFWDGILVAIAGGEAYPNRDK